MEVALQGAFREVPPGHCLMLRRHTMAKSSWLDEHKSQRADMSRGEPELEGLCDFPGYVLDAAEV